MRQVVNPIVRAIRDSIVRGGGSFDIASTNPSAYYDRTNLATLFQDSVGTTPVAAGSQPIGLGLDQSQGLALGPELVVNGDFSDGATGWSASGDFVISGGRASVSVTGSYSTLINSGLALTSGKSYQLSVDIESISGSDIWVRNAADLYLVAASSGTKTLIIPSASSGLVDILSFPDTLVSIKSMSLKTLSGNHASQPTAGKRPITEGSPIYADFDAVDDELITTFPASLGAGCTVCRSLPGTGASITTGVTLTATFTDNVDAHALLIYTAAQWAALDAGKIANITKLLNKKAGL